MRCLPGLPLIEVMSCHRGKGVFCHPRAPLPPPLAPSHPPAPPPPAVVPWLPDTLPGVFSLPTLFYVPKWEGAKLLLLLFCEPWLGGNIKMYKRVLWNRWHLFLKLIYWNIFFYFRAATLPLWIQIIINLFRSIPKIMFLVVSI